MALPPRYVDTLPQPEKVKEKKVILLSYSRSGTHGLHHALNTLGYRTYHMSEVVQNGLRDIKLFHEALTEHLKDPSSPDKRPYTREDLDKWTHSYDALAIIPCYLPQEIISAYPDAKFILTERDPKAWGKSIWNTIAQLHEATLKFPLNFIKQFDEGKKLWCELVNMIFGRVISGGKGRTTEGQEFAVKHYEEYNAGIKKMFAAAEEEKKKKLLLVVKLEDGLDWEAICPFLGVDIPPRDIPYPRGNDPNEFKKIVGGFLGRGNLQLFGMTAASVLVSAVGVWYGATSLVG